VDTNKFIYLYGMTILSIIHKLKEYPREDTYGEILETYRVPGGETGNSALILSNLGYKVKIDGPFLGSNTNDPIKDFYKRYNIDCDGMIYDSSYLGVEDLVIIGAKTRTVFGTFNSFFSGTKRWSKPDENAIKLADIISIDPFFSDESEEVSKLSSKYNKNYITIDCPPDSILNKGAAATIISKEYIENNYKDLNENELFKKYTSNTKGLVIFTFGADKILYGRGNYIYEITPYHIQVKSTLGAGDTFRAGVLHGILNNLDDELTVKFAASVAANVCTRFPFALNPPSLQDILSLIK